MLSCLTFLFTSYLFVLPSSAISLDDTEAEIPTSDNSAGIHDSGVELIKKVETVAKGDLSDTVHWTVENVTDAFNSTTCQVRIYGEGEMPSGLSPWKTYSKTIKKIIIEDGITNVSKEAFSNMSVVVSAELGNDIVTLDEKAFYQCTAMEKINIPDSVREIGNLAIGVSNYSTSKITELKLNYGLETINQLGKLSITSLYIPKSVTTLVTTQKNNYYGFTFPFDYCNSLTEIIIDKDNPNYSSDQTNSSVLSKDGTKLIRVMRAVTGEYTIPNSVTTIGSMAISRCNISSVVFPDLNRTYTIEPGNFHGCNNLTELTLPVLSKWNANDYDTFLMYGCTRLAKVTFTGFTDDFNYNNTFATSCFRECPALKEVIFPEDVYGKITNLGSNTFQNTSISGDLLASFTNLEKLGNNIFSNCHSMDKIVLGENLKTIRADFNNCLSATEVILNSKDLKLTLKDKETAFGNLVSCKKITIGKTVDTLDKYLMDIIFQNNIDEIVFEGPNILTIPNGIVGPAPIDRLSGKYYANENGILYKLNDNQTAELAYFPPNSSLESYTVPKIITAADGITYNVNKVAESAFKNANITSVTFESSSDVTVSSSAFYNCKKLASVNGKTALNDVISSFNNAVPGAFFGTLLTGIESNKGTVTKEPLSVSLGDGTAKFQITANTTTSTTISDESMFKLYTGDLAVVNVSISNPDANQELFGRVYIQYNNDSYTLPATVDTTITNDGFSYTLRKSDRNILF